MKITVDIDEPITNPEITIKVKKFDNELIAIVQELVNSSKIKPLRLVGVCDEKEYFLELDDVYFFESYGNNVQAVTSDAVYTLKYRLFQIEEMFRSDSIFRISKSNLVNINKIVSIEKSFGSPYIIRFKGVLFKLVASPKYIKLLREEIAGQ